METAKTAHPAQPRPAGAPRALAALAGAALFLAGTAGAAPFIGVFIGDNVGLKDEEPLRFAVQDARQMHQVFAQLGELDARRSRVLADQGADGVRRALEQARDDIRALRASGAKPRLFVFYSGHGGDDALHLAGERLPLEWVRNYLAGVDADLKIMVSDACFSGALISSKGMRLGQPLPLGIINDMAVNGTVILTSSSAGELSHESLDLAGSLFTHFLVNGLRGAADFDHDGQITLWEAFAYARMGMAQQALPARQEQTPAFEMDLRGSDQVVLTRISRGQARLTIRDVDAGTYTILDGRSMSLFARLEPKGHDTLTLALPKGGYLVRRSEERKVFLAEADLNSGRALVLTRGNFRSYPLSSLGAKGLPRPGFLPYRVSAWTRAVRGLPAQPGLAWVAGAGAAMDQGSWSMAADLGYLPPGLRRVGRAGLEQSGLGLGAELRYTLAAGEDWKVWLGPRGEFWFLRQELVGYGDHWANPWAGLGKLAYRLELPWSVGLETSLAGGASNWRSLDARTHWQPQYEAGFSLGYRF